MKKQILAQSIIEYWVIMVAILLGIMSFLGIVRNTMQDQLNQTAITVNNGLNQTSIDNIDSLAKVDGQNVINIREDIEGRVNDSYQEDGDNFQEIGVKNSLIDYSEVVNQEGVTVKNVEEYEGIYKEYFNKDYNKYYFHEGESNMDSIPQVGTVLREYEYEE